MPPSESCSQAYATPTVAPTGPIVVATDTAALVSALSLRQKEGKLTVLDKLASGDRTPATGETYAIDAVTSRDIENVPVRAITMGVGTILDAREIVLMANGPGKAAIVREALEGKDGTLIVP